MAKKKSRKTPRKRPGRSPSHPHLFTIADELAVRTLLEKLVGVGGDNMKQEKILKAVADAAGHYDKASRKERQAFFHGLLTGYGVALKLR